MITDGIQAGQPLFIYAAWQNGALRPDSRAALDAARAAGCWTVLVNTGDAGGPGDADVILHRPNRGRDFGSYREALLRSLDAPEAGEIPRITLMNDSVFASRARLPAFLARLLAPGIAVRGATENHEIAPHLGSFCLSLPGSVLRHPAFRRFWWRCRLTGFRPLAIRRGEVALSRLLARIAGPLEAVYDLAACLDWLDADPARPLQALALARSGTHLSWPRLTAAGVAARYAQQEGIAMEPAGLDGDDPEGTLTRHLPSGHPLRIEGLRAAIREELAQIFTAGGQIHQNAALLLAMGCPLIKLDGVYRGALDGQDVARIASLLEPDEAAAFRTHVNRRGYAGDTLAGWQRAAVLRGLM